MPAFASASVLAANVLDTFNGSTAVPLRTATVSKSDVAPSLEPAALPVFSSACREFAPRGIHNSLAPCLS